MNEIVDIASFENKEVLRTYKKLKEHNWPTKNFLKNLSDVEIKEVDRAEFLKKINSKKVEKTQNFMTNHIYYCKEVDFILRKEIVRFASNKKPFIDDDIIDKLISENPMVYNVKGILNIVEATNYYLTTVLFKDDEKPIIIPDELVVLPCIMGLIINKIGIDKFVNMYFNNDYTCLTNEIVDCFGINITRELYKYSAYNLNYKSLPINLLEEIVSVSNSSYLNVIREYRHMLDRGIKYRLSETKIRENFKVVEYENTADKPKSKLLGAFGKFRK